MPLLAELVSSVFGLIRGRSESNSPIGVSTGCTELDEKLGGGLVRQQLSYLVGDSGVGKSWLASSFIVQGARWLSDGGEIATGYMGKNTKEEMAVADKKGKQPLIVFWSLEMAEFQVVTRMLTQVASHLGRLDIDSGKLLRGIVPMGIDSPIMVQSRDWLEKLGKYIFVEVDARSVSDMQQVLAALSDVYDIVLLVVDYFRLIEEVAMDGSMASVQAEKSGKLRDIAKHFDCHVLSIFDINRAGQGQKGGPVASNMRGGVAAQFDADLVMILHPDDPDKGKEMDGKLVLDVVKGRFVAPSTTNFYANLSAGRIEAWKQEGSNGEISESLWGECSGEGDGSSGDREDQDVEQACASSDEHDNLMPQGFVGRPRVRHAHFGDANSARSY